MELFTDFTVPRSSGKIRKVGFLYKVVLCFDKEEAKRFPNLIKDKLDYDLICTVYMSPWPQVNFKIKRKAGEC